MVCVGALSRIFGPKENRDFRLLSDAEELHTISVRFQVCGFCQEQVLKSISGIQRQRKARKSRRVVAAPHTGSQVNVGTE